MARLGINYDTVKSTAINLLSQGVAPSVQKIRELLGTGSNTTIAEHLKAWREEHAKKEIHYLPANIPKELIATFDVLWQTAMEQAQNQLTEYKKALESEQATMLQEQQKSAQAIAELRQNLADITAKVATEVTEKHNTSTELAVTYERLNKQEQSFAVEKEQYEARLKRSYEEKDSLVMQCSQLHKDAKIWQEKLALQTEQHQEILTQQNILQEQSENRWMQLIAQARQETKDANKKLESLRDLSEEQSKNLKTTMSDLQQELYRKTVELNVALQANKLKQKSTLPKLQDKMKNATTGKYGN